MVKRFFIDVETTGTDPSKNGLIQFSGIIEIGDKIKERLDFKIKPYPDDIIEDKALEITGVTHDDIKTYQEPNIVYDQLIEVMDSYVDRYDKFDKFHFIGYNSRFDDSFMRAFWEKNADKFYGSWFHWPAIDVTNLVAGFYIEYRDRFPNYKLIEVAKKLDIEVDESKAHDAFYDVFLTREIYYLMHEKIHEKVKGEGKYEI